MGLSPQETTEPIWPTKEWQMSTPEEQDMDSEELANLVDFGAKHSFDSLLVVRHGTIVVEHTQTTDMPPSGAYPRAEELALQVSRLPSVEAVILGGSAPTGMLDQWV
jgi:hypothetical protein